MIILEVQTEHVAPFKTLFEVLKEMLTETNIEFLSGKSTKKADQSEQAEDTEQETKNKKTNTSCLRINAVDATKTVLINLKLDGEHFSKFFCRVPRLSLGVNLSAFYKLIKTMGKTDTLTLTNSTENKNQLNIKMETPNKVTEYNLKLLDLEDAKMAIPETEFDAIITMNSGEFNRLCREMSSLAEYVEIKCLADKIIFTCVGDVADRTTTYRIPTPGTDEENNVNFINISHSSTTDETNSAPEIVQGIFELKHLVLFGKCSSLCDDIEIYMKNSFPLVIKYTVATLGRILLCLTPITEAATKNSNYNDEMNYYNDD